MTDSVVVCKQDNGVATISLNVPDKHNAFDDRIIAELTDAFQAVGGDRAIRIVVLAASGKSFSAGGDLQWMKRMANYSLQDNLADARALASMLKTLNDLPKPTIARVQGAAFGGAVGLVSCCDFVVASSNASFCLSEVKVGLVPATIAPYVIAAIGQRASRRYFLSAERFSALNAERLGLVSEVVDPEQLDQAVNRFINNLLGNGPAAMAAAKSLIANVADRAVTTELIEHTCALIAEIRVSEEGQEGLSAFLEKRPAAWISENPED
ncbi:MAG: enoyl-CoA hydratase/isomerase family protein [Gammaproteobacteria bacterium]|nr:enoyl-CoA hydratase/isomerase family protein [Gammaproteobacteria bacterium]